MARRGKPTLQDAALRDPLRSSGGLHEAGRMRRGIAEFLRLPLLITAGFTVAAVLVGVLDGAGEGAPLRDVATAVVPGAGATDFISAVATSLMTVTSITFSVLLLAVQQTASSLTPVVFDQYLRRRSNQAYFGFFVGVTAFAFIVLGLARDDPPPVYGAAICLLLTVVALVVLLLLIHSTVDQMRPQSVVRSIHELALRAREKELRFLGRLRAQRRSEEGAPARKIRSLDSGYITTMHVDRLAEAVREVGPDAEAVVAAQLGDYVVFGETLVVLVGVDADDESHDEAVLATIGVDDIRDVDAEAGYAVDQLENIGWSSSTSAGQSPAAATTAVRALADLGVRWLVAGERDRSDRADQGEELPIVYVDGAVERVMKALAALLVATAESAQAQTAAHVVTAFTALVPRLESEADTAALVRAVDSALPAVIQHAELPQLADALTRLTEELDAAGMSSDRLREVRGALTEATARLLPKPSDEPEAARPR